MFHLSNPSLSIDGENERKAILAQNKKLTDEVLAHKKASDGLNEALQNLDRERDHLQAQLDFEAENKMACDLKLRSYEAQLVQYRDMLESAERKHQHLIHELGTANRQVATLDARLNSSKEEVLELKRKISFKSSTPSFIHNLALLHSYKVFNFIFIISAEVSGAAEDLMLMTRENQALTSELAEASYERDGMRRKLQEMQEANAGLEHAKRALEIEKDGQYSMIITNIPIDNL
jgi:chromosome segregation ATPase